MTKIELILDSIAEFIVAVSWLRDKQKEALADNKGIGQPGEAFIITRQVIDAQRRVDKFLESMK